MKKFAIILVIIGLVLAAWFYAREKSEPAGPAPINNLMLLTSPAFKNGEYIPKKFSCEGEGINPELQIQNVPAGAKSLALIVHDPDAPVTGGFTHWLLWNIDPKTTLVKEESVPPGLSAGASAKAGSIEGKNGSGKNSYAAPCPPSGHGVHHYHFKLYALDSMLKLSNDAGKAELEAEIGKHLIAETELVGLYKR